MVVVVVVQYPPPWNSRRKIKRINMPNVSKIHQDGDGDMVSILQINATTTTIIPNVVEMHQMQILYIILIILHSQYPSYDYHYPKMQYCYP